MDKSGNLQYNYMLDTQSFVGSPSFFLENNENIAVSITMPRKKAKEACFILDQQFCHKCEWCKWKNLTSNTDLASESNVLQSISYLAEKVCKNNNVQGCSLETIFSWMQPYRKILEKKTQLILYRKISFWWWNAWYSVSV